MRCFVRTFAPHSRRAVDSLWLFLSPDSRAKWLVVMAWLTSVIFSVPILFFFHLKETPMFGTQCWIEFTHPWQWQVYMTLVSLSVFIVPAIIIAVCYTTITITIWRSDGVYIKVLTWHSQEKQDTAPTDCDVCDSTPRFVQMARTGVRSITGPSNQSVHSSHLSSPTGV